MAERGWLAAALLLVAITADATPAVPAPAALPEYSAYRATVFGHIWEPRAELADISRRDVHALDLYPERDVPPVLWMHEELDYGLAWQDGPAPLVFVISGNGGAFNSIKNRILEQVLWNIGYHVITLGSPTHPNVIVSAHQPGDAMPGLLNTDAARLHGLMQRVLEDVRTRHALDITGYALAGYSLGGAHAASVAEYDQRHPAFGFHRVLVVNPPVDLYDSVRVLDRLVDTLAPGEFAELFADLLRKVSAVYTGLQSVELDEESIYALAATLDMDNETLGHLIGAAFRLASTDMIFALDVLFNVGMITWKNDPPERFESVDDAFRRGLQLGYADYFEQGIVPHEQARRPGTTERELRRRASLERIEAWLRDARHVALITNADDPILVPGQVNWLRGVFGERATIFPRGGHCGNMDRVSFVARIEEVMRIDAPISETSP